MIWCSMIIPIVFCLILYLIKKELSIKPYLFIILSSLMIIFTISQISNYLQTTDTEYWGGWVKNAEYYEPWDEKVSCTHAIYKTEYYTDSNDKRCSRQVFDRYEHPYDVDYHPPYWKINGSNGENISINENKFIQFCNQFGNKSFIDLHRNYHNKDGDKYVTIWDMNQKTCEPLTSIHHYENRIKNSSSIFKYQKVDPKKYGLVDYPEIYDQWKCPSILGFGIPTMNEGESLLNYYNAILGSKKQLKMWIIIFKNKPIEAGFDQESYWSGGNKNEFNIIINIDNNYKPTWCHVFSWCDQERLKIDIREYVMLQEKVDLVNTVEYMQNELKQKFIRKQFADFKYISVETPLKTIIITIILLIVLCSIVLGLSLKQNI